MTRVTVLTPGFASPNGCAFLYPLIRHRRVLADLGIDVRISNGDADLAALTDGDALIVDSKFYSARWITESDALVEHFSKLKQSVAKLFYFDITDSSGWDHVRVLPHVTGYFKNQLLRDRSHYLKPIYGHRLYADFYHRTEGVEDRNAASSEPIADPALLDKLQVGWNSGLADYAWLGPLRMALFRHLPLAGLLSGSPPSVPAAAQRPLALSCRIGTAYARDTVAWQRRALRQRLAARLSSDKLSRRGYLRELARSRIVVSPFGLGEITLRDFEIFQAGALALKPDMSHMETWPDLFRTGETIATHCWDLSDLEETIDRLLADPQACIEMAQCAQDAYLRHLTGPEAGALFAARLESLLAVGDTEAATPAP